MHSHAAEGESADRGNRCERDDGGVRELRRKLSPKS